MAWTLNEQTATPAPTKSYYATRTVSHLTPAGHVGLFWGVRPGSRWPARNGYPTVEVDHDAIYVRDGNIWTPAG